MTTIMSPTRLQTAKLARAARAAAAILAVIVVPGLAAQEQPSVSASVAVRRPEVTRAELESLATAAERQGRTADATAIRARLEHGDFFQGDRVILTVTGGETPFGDTVVVVAGQKFSLEGYPDISLRGVLRSELKDHLTRELGRFIRTPVVQTRPLLRLTLGGGVSQPGFYSVPTDAAVTDVIMQAGGPVSNAVLDRTVIKRAATTVWQGEPLQDAMRRGLTIDQLGLQAGDEIEVGYKKPRNLAQIGQLVTVAVSLLGLVITLSK